MPRCVLRSLVGWLCSFQVVACVAFILMVGTAYWAGLSPSGSNAPRRLWIPAQALPLSRGGPGGWRISRDNGDMQTRAAYRSNLADPLLESQAGAGGSSGGGSGDRSGITGGGNRLPAEVLQPPAAGIATSATGVPPHPHPAPARTDPRTTAPNPNSPPPSASPALANLTNILTVTNQPKPPSPAPPTLSRYPPPAPLPPSPLPPPPPSPPPSPLPSPPPPPLPPPPATDSTSLSLAYLVPSVQRLVRDHAGAAAAPPPPPRPPPPPPAQPSRWCENDVGGEAPGYHLVLLASPRSQYARYLATSLVSVAASDARPTSVTVLWGAHRSKAGGGGGRRRRAAARRLTGADGETGPAGGGAGGSAPAPEVSPPGLLSRSEDASAQSDEEEVEVEAELVQRLEMPSAPPSPPPQTRPSPDPGRLQAASAQVSEGRIQQAAARRTAAAVAAASGGGDDLTTGHYDDEGDNDGDSLEEYDSASSLLANLQVYEHSRRRWRRQRAAAANRSTASSPSGAWSSSSSSAVPPPFPHLRVRYLPDATPERDVMRSYYHALQVPDQVAAELGDPAFKRLPLLVLEADVLLAPRFGDRMACLLRMMQELGPGSGGSGASSGTSSGTNGSSIDADWLSTPDFALSLYDPSMVPKEVPDVLQMYKQKAVPLDEVRLNDHRRLLWEVGARAGAGGGVAERRGEVDRVGDGGAGGGRGGVSGHGTTGGEQQVDGGRSGSQVADVLETSDDRAMAGGEREQQQLQPPPPRQTLRWQRQLQEEEVGVEAAAQQQSPPALPPPLPPPAQSPSPPSSPSPSPAPPSLPPPPPPPPEQAAGVGQQEERQQDAGSRPGGSSPDGDSGRGDAAAGGGGGGAAAGREGGGGGGSRSGFFTRMTLVPSVWSWGSQGLLYSYGIRISLLRHYREVMSGCRPQDGLQDIELVRHMETRRCVGLPGMGRITAKPKVTGAACDPRVLHANESRQDAEWLASRASRTCYLFAVRPNLVQHIGASSALFGKVSKRYHMTFKFPGRVSIPGLDPDNTW